MTESYIFTSESVSEGHPDKIADQISDAILDAALAQDPYARVACETLVKTGMVIVAGEMATTGWVDVEQIVRDTVYEIGYEDASLGFDYKSCAVTSAIGKQSPDIAQGIRQHPSIRTSESAPTHLDGLGAGDQGLMFGYASCETPELMPAPILYAHRLMQHLAEARKNGRLPWLRPDAKSQISLRYVQGRPHSVSAVVVSTQHAPEIALSELREAVLEEIIKPTLPAEWLTAETRYLINPAGRFTLGGPKADTGLTGRKIIVDTYGGMARHGGGCFSGKDPTKVDRSGAYAARYIAKNIVAAGLADRCEVQVAYAIGVAEPTAVYVHTFGTGKVPENKLMKLIRQHFPLEPQAIIEHLGLLQPIYRKTAAYGHFGREEADFSWERTDKAEYLREAAAVGQTKVYA